MAHAKPKYELIADKLLSEVKDGKHPVGAFLPTENSLMRSYGVSRHTVRFAIQSLKRRGMIASLQGQGSKVINAQPEGAFIEKIQSIDELIAYGQETTRDLVSRRTIETNADLANKFSCSEGRRIAEARMLRKTTEASPTTIAIVTFWMDVLIEPVIEDLVTIRKSASEIIAEKYGFTTKSVSQTITAEIFNQEDADALDIPVGLPALVIERRYSTSLAEEPLLIARSICRADKMKIVSNFVSSN